MTPIDTGWHFLDRKGSGPKRYTRSTELLHFYLRVYPESTVAFADVEIKLIGPKWRWHRVFESSNHEADARQWIEQVVEAQRILSAVLLEATP